MMIKETVGAVIKDALQQLLKDAAADVSYVIERPQDSSHGDWSTNVAMASTRILKRKPREIAQELVDLMQTLPGAGIFEKFDIAGPGFVNFYLKPTVYAQELKKILEQEDSYGRLTVGQGQRARIEFISANPTGPLHVGHGRGAIIGDVLSSLYDFAGYEVVREYYLNDCGNQMNILGKTSLAWIEALNKGEEPVFDEDGEWYRGAYMKDVAEQLIADQRISEDLFEMGRRAGQEILKLIQQDLLDFGVKPFDLWSSEKDLHDSGKVQNCLDVLQAKGMIQEKDGAWWFLSSQLGDEKDRVVRKSDGALTYLAADIAFHQQKYDDGFDCVIDIWGADHHGYIARVRGAIEAMGYDAGRFTVLLCQLVRLTRGTEIVPMSTRAGEFVTLADIVKEVGKDVARYYFMMRKSDAQLDFDLELAKQQSMDNPVYYIQYAHARICSIQKNCVEEDVVLGDISSLPFEALKDKEEVALMKQLSIFPEMIEGAVRNNEPHRMATYLQDLASAFHSFYGQCRVLTEDVDVTQARLGLLNATQVVLKNGLGILGLSVPKEM